MTYCVGMLLDSGLVMASDTRTNAGVDNVGRFRKLHTWQIPGQCVFALLTAGNLAVTQAVVSELTEEIARVRRRGKGTSLFTDETMFQAARRVGNAIREVRRIDGEALAANSESFHASFIFGGQVGTEAPRMFHIYTAGNFIEATPDTPFFQIGEHKYGKPILDRVATMGMPVGQAAKLLLLSFDSTVRSNLSVGLPIDLLTYEKGSLRFAGIRRIEADNPYFRTLSLRWGQALKDAFREIEGLDEELTLG